MSSREHECPRCGKVWHCEGYNGDGTYCHTGEIERLCVECIAACTSHVCEVCGAPVREGLRVCAGLSLCWYKIAGLEDPHGPKRG